MKNLFIIILLGVLQCACSTQMPQQQQSGALLQFSDLASEITVNHETESATTASSDVVAESPVDSS